MAICNRLRHIAWQRAMELFTSIIVEDNGEELASIDSFSFELHVQKGRKVRNHDKPTLVCIRAISFPLAIPAITRAALSNDDSTYILPPLCPATSLTDHYDGDSRPLFADWEPQTINTYTQPGLVCIVPAYDSVRAGDHVRLLYATGQRGDLAPLLHMQRP